MLISNYVTLKKVRVMMYNIRNGAMRLPIHDFVFDVSTVRYTSHHLWDICQTDKIVQKFDLKMKVKVKNERNKTENVQIYIGDFFQNFIYKATCLCKSIHTPITQTETRVMTIAKICKADLPKIKQKQKLEMRSLAKGSQINDFNNVCICRCVIPLE